MPKTLLVADDMLPIQQYLQRHLERAGYTVLTCGNGQEALDLLRLERVDAVITDIFMPVMDGIALSKAIKVTYQIPVILMEYGCNTKPKDVNIAELREVWSDTFDDVVIKPFLFPALLSSLEVLLGNMSSEDLRL